MGRGKGLPVGILLAERKKERRVADIRLPFTEVEKRNKTTEGAEHEIGDILKGRWRRRLLQHDWYGHYVAIKKKTGMKLIDFVGKRWRS